MTAHDLGALATPTLLAVTFLLALVSGLVPFVINMELYLLAVMLLTDASPVAVVSLMTMGQMLGKLCVYHVGRGSLSLAWIRRRAVSRAAAVFASRPANGVAVMAMSSVTGFPPFYATSFMAGVLRLPVAAFLVIGTAGRLLRFSAVVAFPALFR